MLENTWWINIVPGIVLNFIASRFFWLQSLCRDPHNSGKQCYLFKQRGWCWNVFPLKKTTLSAVRLAHPFHRIITKFSGVITNDRSDVHAKGQGHSVSGKQLQFEFTEGFEMMHKPGCNVEEVPYIFPGHPSNVKVTRTEKSTIWIQFE